MRRWAGGLLVAFAATACNAILGIESHDLDPNVPTSEGGPDAGGSTDGNTNVPPDAPLDAATDAPLDAPNDSPVDALTTDSCVAADGGSTALPYSTYVHPTWTLPASQPGANYTVSTVCGDALVTDKSTGLVWAQDIEPGDYAWADAKAQCEASRRAGFSDWRLPTRIELTSLVDFVRASVPAIDIGVFPSTTSPLWTASPYVNQPNLGWFVDFSKGNTWYGNPADIYKVRCVRSPTAPAGARYTILPGDTEVKDNFTGLVWARAEEPGTYTLANAATRCSSKGGGYRLPAIRELESLVDETAIGSPAIDRATFPGATAGTTWSSSAYVYAGGLGWRVDFTHGDSGTLGVGGSAVVRCVR